MIYAPRNEDELEVVCALVREACLYAAGRKTQASGYAGATRTGRLDKSRPVRA